MNGETLFFVPVPDLAVSFLITYSQSSQFVELYLLTVNQIIKKTNHNLFFLITVN